MFKQQQRQNNISLRLAAENYHGAPVFNVELMQNNAPVWRATELSVAGGLDTVRFGPAESRDRLAWQTVGFSAEYLPENSMQLKSVSKRCRRRFR